MAYLSLDGLMRATGVADAGETFCAACFTGDYPCEVPAELRCSKFRYEENACGSLPRLSRPGPVDPVLPGAGQSPPPLGAQAASAAWAGVSTSRPLLPSSLTIAVASPAAQVSLAYGRRSITMTFLPSLRRVAGRVRSGAEIAPTEEHRGDDDHVGLSGEPRRTPAWLPSVKGSNGGADTTSSSYALRRWRSRCQRRSPRPRWARSRASPAPL